MTKRYLHKPTSLLKFETIKILLDFEIQNESQIPGLKTKKKKSCHLVTVAIPAEQRVKIKESEKLSKYLDLDRELKNLWNMKVMVTPVVVVTLGMVPKSIGKRLGGHRIKIKESEKINK